MGRKNVCFQCVERSAECHATCERYADYVKQREEFRNQRFKERCLIRSLDDLKAGCIRNYTHNQIKL